MNDLMLFPDAVRRDPRIEDWFTRVADPHRLMAREWFERMRRCGADVRELLHDGCPVACVGDAAFGYVNAFKAHANVGFFHGAALADPAGLLEGGGKRMRHVKLRPGKETNVEALSDLIAAAYADIRQRLSSVQNSPVPMRTQNAVESMKKINSKKSTAKGGGASPAPARVGARIAALTDWRGVTLTRIRALIREADPRVVETVKWRKPSNGMLGVPVWEHDGIICTGETYKGVVKLTFAKGAALEDPRGLFNAGLDGNVRRAIDIREGDEIDEKAFKALIRAAVKLNTSARASSPPARSRKKP